MVADCFTHVTHDQAAERLAGARGKFFLGAPI
jgi:hypothetical protein